MQRAESIRIAHASEGRSSAGQLQLDLADRDYIARPNPRLAGHPLAVDPGSVSGVEIGNPPPPVPESYDGVPCRRECVAEDYAVVRPAADGGAADNGEGVPGLERSGAGFDHNQASGGLGE